MSHTQYNVIYTAAHRLVHRNNPDELAKVLGKTGNSLRNEVNPNLTGPKLGLVDAVKLTLATDDFTLLQACNMACGYLAVPLMSIKVTDDKTLIQDWAEWQNSVGKTCEAITDALNDNKVTPNELAEIQAAGLRKTGAFLQLLNTVSSRCAIGETHHAG